MASIRVVSERQRNAASGKIVGAPLHDHQNTIYYVYGASSSKRSACLQEDQRLAAENTDAILCFRQLLWVAQRLRYLMDHGCATMASPLNRGAAHLGAACWKQPSLTEAALAMGTSYQNVKQLVAALERKGMLKIVGDAD